MSTKPRLQRKIILLRCRPVWKPNAKKALVTCIERNSLYFQRKTRDIRKICDFFIFILGTQRHIVEVGGGGGGEDEVKTGEKSQERRIIFLFAGLNFLSSPLSAPGSPRMYSVGIFRVLGTSIFNYNHRLLFHLRSIVRVCRQVFGNSFERNALFVSTFQI